MIENIKRTSCCICDSTELILNLFISRFPIFMGTTLNEQSLDIFSDQKWVVCENCGCLQLGELIPLEVLYAEQRSSGEVGTIWKNHHLEFSKFILEDNLSSICEIGAGHCELANTILDQNPETKYLIIEPHPRNTPKRATVISGHIEDNLDEVFKYDAIVHSHVIEHIYEPKEFISNLATGMKQDTHMYISFPNMAKLIETQGTNSLNFEHTFYLHPDQLKSLLRNYGLSVSREKKFREHSYFFKITKAAEVKSGDSLIKIHSFANDFKIMWDDLKSFTQKTNLLLAKDSTPTYLFGAHVFSQALISLGLNTQNIIGVLDNAADKENQRLYGTELSVYNPSVLEKYEKVNVVLKASHYQEEIRQQLCLINAKTLIIE